ncbi:glycosyltransferase [Paracoccaceae bacterium]|nr:glycosyltransferase [Paracoccaceae bacterium]
MKFLVISENAAYNLGGAERSLYQYCKTNIASNDELSVVSSLKDHQRLQFSSIGMSCSVSLLSTKPFSLFSRLSLLFTQLIMLKHFFKIVKFVRNHDVILTQNRWAPYISIIFLIIRYLEPQNEKKLIYFIRDEKCLCYYKCYANGWRRFAWYCRHVLETPFRLIHKFISKFALSRTSTVFNSKFMLSFAERVGFEINGAIVEYPQIEEIDKSKCTNWLITQDQIIKKLHRSRAFNIAMVGGEVIKGIECFEKLSNLHPNLNFVNFSKERSQISQINNVYYLPWQSTPGIPYFMAKTLIVPSIWMEAYGRVVVEAKQFNCNIIISNKGGLVEALADYKNGFVCDSINSFSNSINKCVT